MKTLRAFVMGLLLVLAVYALPVLAQDYLQEEFNQVYDLAAGGAVSLKNVNGSVTVSAWDQSRVQVHAIKKGKSQSDMDQVRIEINPDPNRLTIQTIHPRQNSGDGVSVSYDLMVPRNVNLDKIESVNGSVRISDVSGQINAHTVNGSITVANSNGATNATTVNGSIQVELGQVDANKEMKFTTTNGSIKVQMPANISAQVRAKTLNGGIQTDFPLTVQGKFNSKSMDGTLGNGGPLLSFETVNGAIKLMKK